MGSKMRGGEVPGGQGRAQEESGRVVAATIPRLTWALARGMTREGPGQAAAMYIRQAHGGVISLWCLK